MSTSQQAGVVDEADRRFMTRALELARLGIQTTHPNPRVGCVLARDGTVLAEGWHERAGGPHAEVVALRAAAAAGVDVRGATAYVTLEPCSHQGRTPPCSDALIAAGITRVVAALGDPNPQVNGRGFAQLRAAGIRVDTGLMAVEAAQLNAGFLKRMAHGLPFVRLKLAMSLDGRTALANGASQWLTSEAAREDVQHWRAASAAMLTGIGTVLADDPRLSVRLPGTVRQPLRVVLDRHLQIPPSARLFEGAQGVLVFTTAGTLAAAEEHRAALERAGARVLPVPGNDNGRLDLSAVMRALAAEGVNEVFAETGARMAGPLLQAGVVDELLLYVAPMLLGPLARPLVDWPPLASLDEAPHFALHEAAQIGPDLRLRLRPA